MQSALGRNLTPFPFPPPPSHPATNSHSRHNATTTTRRFPQVCPVCVCALTKTPAGDASRTQWRLLQVAEEAATTVLMVATLAIATHQSGSRRQTTARAGKRPGLPEERESQVEAATTWLHTLARMSCRCWRCTTGQKWQLPPPPGVPGEEGGGTEGDGQGERGESEESVLVVREGGGGGAGEAGQENPAPEPGRPGEFWEEDTTEPSWIGFLCSSCSFCPLSR